MQVNPASNIYQVTQNKLYFFQNMLYLTNCYESKKLGFKNNYRKRGVNLATLCQYTHHKFKIKFGITFLKLESTSLGTFLLALR